MLFTKEEFDNYIISKYEKIEDIPEDSKIFKDYCSKCNAIMGLDIEAKNAGATQKTFGRVVYKIPPNWDLPFNLLLSCPVCRSKKILFLHRILLSENNYDLYKLYSIPELEDYSIPQLPPKPESLITTYEEAIKCLQFGAYKASAAMFRRALQIIVREILGSKEKWLASALKNLKNSKNSLGILLSSDFHQYSYIIKEAGNQAAHPDQDPDLLDFTKQDALDLRDIFLEIVNELFVKPALLKKAEENLLNKRKIK
jgi:hypothetical protein